MKEFTIEQARERLAKNPQTILLDIREDQEWEQEHAVEAVHLGRGVLERDIEKLIPDTRREIIIYCGGGYRSVLAAASVQKMGYWNVYSLMGGYRGMVQAKWPMRSDAKLSLNENRSGGV